MNDNSQYATPNGLTLLVPSEGNISLMKLLKSYWEMEVQTINQEIEKKP
jgi:hypothetical protein